MTSLISIQLNGQDCVASNLTRVTSLVEKACASADEHRLVVLPECFSLFGVTGEKMLNNAELIGNGPIQDTLKEIARNNKCFLVAGTTPIVDEIGDTKYYAASLVFNPNGDLMARYNKMHLFDVDVADKTSAYRESRYTSAGQYLSMFDFAHTTVAQAVCYDLRFPEMFAAYANQHASKQAPGIVVLPSAFTKVTGKAHWHALLQARSIENQSFIVASNQTGVHADARETFGNSCIYSPWGECLSLIEEHEGYAIANFDQDQIDNVRIKMPICAHKKERYSFES